MDHSCAILPFRILCVKELGLKLKRLLLCTRLQVTVGAFVVGVVG